ncbi:MAG: hypothetical protein BEN19_08895 [Epulopiscium sp. Nuni2H_MBin003]|nr:MAG: hypothetical protein BEN19_08895 [Epulopiscium sp. Nuni2H_MBin003]
MKKEILKDRLIITMIIYSFVISIIGIIFNADISYVIGVCCGTLVAIYRLISLNISLNKAVHLPEDKAINYSRGQYLIRYVITGATLILAALLGISTLIGVFLGLIGIKVAVFSELFYHK